MPPTSQYFFGMVFGRYANNYELLPTESRPSSSYQYIFQSCAPNFRKRVRWRRPALAALVITFLMIAGFLRSGIPPNFANIYEFERKLPQQNTSSSSAKAMNRMYLRDPGFDWGHGLNNYLQEVIFMSHLAYLSNRSYVFEKYTWSHTRLPFTIYDFALRPARMPLNAFISGPTAGGQFANINALSAVNSEFWEKVCPKENRIIISTADGPGHGEGIVILDWWVRKLKEVSSGCVEIDHPRGHPIFDMEFFGSTEVLETWSSISQSPILTHFSWSPLVLSAVTRNFALLQPSLRDLHGFGNIQGLAAIHLRRGDFVRHCVNLASWRTLYMGFNRLPDYLDKFEPPAPSPNATTAEADAAHRAVYSEHCWPDIPRIVSRLAAVRRVHPGLHRVYVLSNGWPWWISSVRSALRADGWENIVSSLDLSLDAEQRWVDNAVDMSIAQRADVFVGNGFSTLTANVNMLRLARGVDPTTNRFW